MDKVAFQNGYVLCVEHSEFLQPADFFSDEPEKLLFEEEKLKTYDVVVAGDGCSLDLQPFDEILVSSEGTKFRISEEDTAVYGFPRDAKWAWVFKNSSVVAKVVE